MDLQSRLANAFQRYASARNQVEQYSRTDGLLDKSQRTLDLIRAGYRADEFGALELLSAQRTYFQTNLAYLDAQRELWTAAMEIRGLRLKGSLSP
jgi:cobalt-zinc-cadmium efflux system outer membrane protein